MVKEVRDKSGPGRDAGQEKDSRLSRILTVWQVVVVILIALAAGLLVLLVHVINAAYRRGYDLGDDPHDLPPAQVVIGEPLGWRRISIPADPPFFGQDTIPAANLNLAIGDIDGDGADELLAHAFTRGAWLIDLDGTMSQIELDVSEMLQSFTWDCDGDGDDDLLLENFSQAASSISVLDVSGTVLAEFEQLIFGLSSGTADLDGDGLEDLVVESFDPSDPEVVVITAGDRRPQTFEADLHLPCFGDTDGDGVDEAINLDLFGQDGFTTYGLDGIVAEYPGWDTQQIPSGCSDLDRDGIDEVFAGGHGYLNLVTGAYYELSYPYPGGQHGSGWDKGLKALDLDRDGQLELVTTGSADGPDTAVLIFEVDGSCVYCEELGTYIDNFHLANNAGGEGYLVLKTHDAVLIYP